MHRALACALTILHGFGDVLWQPWRAENYSFLRMRGNSDAQKGAACSYVTLYVRGAMLALPTRSSGERRTHSSEWEGTQTPEREWHAHRWPSMVRGTVLALPTMLRRERHAHWWHSMVRGAMLAWPTRRATYDGALGSRELIPQNERELRRSEGSGMLIGDPLWWGEQC